MRGQPLTDRIPAPWRAELSGLLDAPWLDDLARFVEDERSKGPVYPPEDQVFTALAATPPDAVRVVLLGQDPYVNPGQAHGLAFSVTKGTRPPPSLVNLFTELTDDIGCPKPKDGYLMPWAEQGVLLLNTVLTVRQGEPGSHRRRGWERFTDAILERVNARSERIVFLLWGADAQKKRKLIDEDRHVVIASAHPSPLSARRGFFGSRPFSKVNAALREAGRREVDWCLPG